MDSIREAIGILTAGIIGSFIGTASKRNDSPLAMIVSLVAGITSAYIFTPIICHYFLQGTSVSESIGIQIGYAVAFVLGLLGMTLISMVMAVFETLRQNPKEIISIVKDIIIKK